MILATVLAMAMQPKIMSSDQTDTVSLELIVPVEFGEWVHEIDQAQTIVNPVQQATLDGIYAEILTRIYTNEKGYKMMLSIAYGRDQRKDMAVHYPEFCYLAQGFEVNTNVLGQIHSKDKVIPVRRLETVLNDQRFEPVTYWTTIGDFVTVDKFDKRIIGKLLGIYLFIISCKLFYDYFSI